MVKVGTWLALLMFAQLLAVAQDAIPSSYDAQTIFDKKGLTVSFYKGPQDGERVSDFLLIRIGAKAYLETWFGRSIYNSIDSVAARLLDSSQGSLLAVTVKEHNRGFTGMDASIDFFAFEDPDGTPVDAGALELPYLDYDLSVAPLVGKGGFRLTISPAKVAADSTEPEDWKTLYADYDPDKVQVSKEPPFDAGLAQKRVTEPDPYAMEADATRDASYCQLNDDRVNLRAQPGVDGSVIKVLPRNTLFSVIDRSDSPQTIGGKTDRWYKVLLRGTSTTGWIFGAFVLRS